MDHERMDQYLDAMLDGTITKEELEAVEAHCRECPECAQKLEANRAMMRLFGEMDPEMDVPLSAQAAWRGAIKREANKKGRGRLYRFAGGIAAALAVALVAGFMLKSPVATERAATMRVDMAEEFSDSEEALIEADGAAVQMSAMNKAAGAPMHEVVLIVRDVDRTCEYAQDLAEEYGGHLDIQRYDEDGAPCANLYVDLPAENAGAFLEAIKPFDLSGANFEAFDAGAGEASLMLVLKTE